MRTVNLHTKDEPEYAELGGLLSPIVTKGHLPEHERCRRLWIKILLQQVFDASTKSKKPEVLALKQTAKAWLLSNSKDFREVCDNAGFNPDNGYRAFRRIFNSPDPDAILQALLPKTQDNGQQAQSRRGPKPKTIHDYQKT